MIKLYINNGYNPTLKTNPKYLHFSYNGYLTLLQFKDVFKKYENFSIIREFLNKHEKLFTYEIINFRHKSNGLHLFQIKIKIHNKANEVLWILKNV